jgi:hypothetical protein
MTSETFSETEFTVRGFAELLEVAKDCSRASYGTWPRS